MQIKKNESLSKHTTFCLGGKAKYFYEVENIQDLEKALNFAREKDKPYFIIGGGSNIIVNDRNYNGFIVKISNKKYQISNECIEVDAGVGLGEVVEKSLENNLVGLEWATMIPGTVGGAVRGNAGAYRGEMKDCVELITVFRDGELIELKNQDCKFGYRESIFKSNGDIIWSVRLRLRRGRAKDLEEMREKIKKIKNERMKKFGDQKSVGSFFKNILMGEKEIKDFKKKFSELPDEFVKYKKIPAAWLIEQCGLRGFCLGGVGVSEKHAGILVNYGEGTYEELVHLVDLIKTKVRTKFGVELQEEIQYLK